MQIYNKNSPFLFHFIIIKFLLSNLKKGFHTESLAIISKRYD